ncbi:MAG: MraY family glycosyltransferase [Candidatus Margulisiibacteriota bacterium]
MIIYFIVFMSALLLSVGLTYIVRKFALAKGIVDAPTAQNLHEKAVPNIGGLAICLAFLVTVVLITKAVQLPLIIAASIIVVVGLLDDFQGITPLGKLFGQVIAAIILIGSGIKIGCFPDAIGIPLTLFWLVGMTNAINLLDGMDGLAAGVSAIAALFFMILALGAGDVNSALLAVALAGACIGFLRFNFHKASIFMGDTGSLFLGFMLAALAVIYSQHNAGCINLFVPLIILGVPVADTAFAIMRRLWQRRSIFNSDTDHFYEWLWKNRKMEYRSIVVLVYIICIIMGLAGLALAWVLT